MFVLARYNIPPIRAIDLANQRGHHHRSITNTVVTVSPSPVGPIGPRNKNNKSKSGMRSQIFFIFIVYFSSSSNV